MKKFFILITIIILIFIITIITKYQNVYKTIYKPPKVSYTPTPQKNEFLFAFIGYGGDGHEGAYLTDSVILVHVNMIKKRITLISVPRDIWISVPTKSGNPFGLKINALYQLGFFPTLYPDINTKSSDKLFLFKNAIKSITNLNLDYYVSIDFKGFMKAVDALGGVEINVKKSFDDYVYPIEGKENDLCDYPEDKLSELDLRLATEEPQIIFPCRYEHVHFEKGTQIMDGNTALKYVRSRHGLEDGGDFGRASRQQEFLLAFKNKLLSFNSLPRIIQTAEIIAPFVQTDIPQSVITKLIKNVFLLKNIDIEQIILSEDNVLTSDYSEETGYILIPKDKENKWKSVHEYIQIKLQRITPTPIVSPSIKTLD